MDEQGTQETQGRPHAADVQEESFTLDGVTYRGPVMARYARLRLALDLFRGQVQWLEGYLFIVGEYFESRDGSIPEQTMLGNLDAVPGVASDVTGALEDVEHRAAELRRAAAPSVTGEKAEERLYSAREAAERLGVAPITLLRARKAGRIGFYQIGARVLFSETEHLRPFLDGCNQRPGAGQEEPPSGGAGPSPA